MILEKAIEILTLLSKEPNTSLNIDHNLALILGIEALKRVKRIKDNPHSPYYALLPGETKE